MRTADHNYGAASAMASASAGIGAGFAGGMQTAKKREN
jgi:hypothetical protein